MDLSEERNEALERIVELADDSEISSIKSIVSGILDIINNPRSSAKDLKELIEIDPPLTARVLRVANSAYYASRKKIGDIEQAVIWIGFDALKEIALSQKVCEIFGEDKLINGYSRTFLWKHSVAVALLAKMIYRKEFGERGENIYAAGLLHEIGIILEDQFLQEEFKLILEKSTNENRNLTDIEFEVLSYNHANVGKSLTDLWDFPRDLVITIGYHHNPLNTPQIHLRMALTLYISDYFCQVNSIGYGDMPKLQRPVLNRCIERLGLEIFSVNMIVEEMKKEIVKMEDRGLLKSE